jgi:hypothetical protein
MNLKKENKFGLLCLFILIILIHQISASSEIILDNNWLNENYDSKLGIDTDNFNGSLFLENNVSNFSLQIYLLEMFGCNIKYI